MNYYQKGSVSLIGTRCLQLERDKQRAPVRTDDLKWFIHYKKHTETIISHNLMGKNEAQT